MIHCRGEKPVIGFPFGFGVIHCGIGALEESFRIRAIVGINSDTDAGAGIYLPTPHYKRQGKEGKEPLSCDGGAFLIGYRGQDYDELIAAESGNGIGFTHVGGKPFRNFSEQSVAEVMSLCVIYILEVVQIEEE
jgi:hypothetical protein